MQGIRGLPFLSMRWMRISELVLAVALISIPSQAQVHSEPQEPAVAFPLRPSANQRYLVDQNNLPFLIAGDSPQFLILHLSVVAVSLKKKNRQTIGLKTL